MKVIYIAGPFRGATPWEQEQNVRRAEELSLRVWKAGHVAICPHTQTRFFQGSASDKTWLYGTLEMMRRCDAVLLIPGWEKSAGTLGEIDEANRIGLPVYKSVSEINITC